jgi:hypothetical protein
MALENQREHLSYTEENVSSPTLDIQSVSSATLADIADDPRYIISN